MSLSIKEAAAQIRAGGLVAFPTETVYGLGANALDACAVQRIYELKGRPATSPLIVHVSSVEMATAIVQDWPPLADELARRWWPGPLSLVLPKRSEIPDIVTAGLSTVGVRMPAHPIALDLIREAGVPIAAPSANRFTGLSPTTADHVREAFGDAVDLIDGGPCQVGIESTVVAFGSGALKLLRPGMIPLGELEQRLVSEGEAHPAPGMHERHYSPRTPLFLVAGGEDDRFLSSAKAGGAYVWRVKRAACLRSIHMPEDAGAYAAQLYAVLHELDRENRPWIAVELPPETTDWAAIHDRLRRAAANRG